MLHSVSFVFTSKETRLCKWPRNEMDRFVSAAQILGSDYPLATIRAGKRSSDGTAHCHGSTSYKKKYACNNAKYTDAAFTQSP